MRWSIVRWSENEKTGDKRSFSLVVAAANIGAAASTSQRRKYYQNSSNRVKSYYTTEHVWTFHLWQVGDSAMSVGFVSAAGMQHTLSKTSSYANHICVSMGDTGIYDYTACSLIMLGSHMHPMLAAPCISPRRHAGCPCALAGASLQQEFLDFGSNTLNLSYQSYDLNQHLDGEPLQVGPLLGGTNTSL